MIKVRKSSFLLLEVLIAFALVVMCIIPLIYPHTYILKTQKNFIHKVKLDHLVNLLYVDILERLYRNEIPWDVIINQVAVDVDEQTLERINFKDKLPFKGTYKFSDIKHKPKDDSPYKHYLLKLEFSFIPTRSKEKALNYIYELFVVRDLNQKGPL